MIKTNDTQRALYELREKSNKDRNSALENSRMNGIQEGMEIGEKKGKLETARKMLSKGMSREDIMELTGLTLEEIESFK